MLKVWQSMKSSAANLLCIKDIFAPKVPAHHDAGEIRVIRTREKGMIVKIVGRGSCEDYREGDYLELYRPKTGKNYCYRVIRCHDLGNDRWEAIVVHPSYPVKWD